MILNEYVWKVAKTLKAKRFHQNNKRMINIVKLGRKRAVEVGWLLVMCLNGRVGPSFLPSRKSGSFLLDLVPNCIICRRHVAVHDSLTKRSWLGSFFSLEPTVPLQPQGPARHTHHHAVNKFFFYSFFFFSPLFFQEIFLSLSSNEKSHWNTTTADTPSTNS